ncbi:MAG: protein-glutamate O-methyltransferase CheR [Desulfobacteraceae bacterium]|nr:protein-glutamate O-methyltransferase CheR [Desulfobacteraceae bacterium]
MLSDLNKIINYLSKHQDIDFYGYHHSIIEQQLDQRLHEVNLGTLAEYYNFLQSHPDEINKLVKVLIINVSSFFRDPLVFNYIASKILPELLSNQGTIKPTSLRIWSAGCAAGEEPYSMAMEIDKLIKFMTTKPIVHIFATDIDTDSIRKAKTAVYSLESLNNVQFEYLPHFIQRRNTFSLNGNIKQLVDFSTYDLLDKRGYSPPESLYGSFDIVLCRNILIYYNKQYKNRILTKLYRSLNKNGYLVLGETEMPTRQFHDNFKKINDFCHIFKKVH